MAKIEKEIKILDINVDEAEQKLNEMGAVFNGKKDQKIFVYDIPTIYYRFCEIKELLGSENKLIADTNLRKFKNVLMEVEDLSTDDDWKKILTILGIKDIMSLKNEKGKIIKNINSSELDEIIREFKINPNKWVRLRKSNDEVKLTAKHIFDKPSAELQKVVETEIHVDSLEETNRILEEIGLVSRSYQEKVRISYEYKEAKIDIDIWPMLKPYMEIESENPDLIKEIINLLKYEDKEVVSLNTEKLYKRIGIDLQALSQLKF